MAAEDLKTTATEFMKKVLTVGVGTLFLTEDSLKGLISEFKLPKELLTGVLESASKTRKEFMDDLSKEIMDKVMERVNPSEIVEELLSRNEVEFTIKVSLKPKSAKKAKSQA